MKRSILAVFGLLMIGMGHGEIAAQVSTQRVIHLLPRPVSTAPDPLVPVGTPGFAPAPITPPRVQPPTPTPVVIPTIPHTPPAAQGPLPPGVLAWDAELKETTVNATQPIAQLVFNFTNISASEVSINHVGTSCGCTVAQLPPMPWKLAPGTNGTIPVTMNVAGKSGMVFKTLTINTDKGWKMLSVKTTIQPPPAQMTAGNREQNLLLAKADRQAVFKGQCASCHVEKAIGKMGKDLYDSACGICHEAEHRASMVPDLHALKHETNAEYWKVWVEFGKQGSLMPAFAQRHGGPLSDQQIASLVDHLVKTIPSKVNTAATTPAPTTASAVPSPAASK
jgi:mono/diheme cytochrome c family protein